MRKLRLAIETKELTKTFPSSRRRIAALSGINLAVEEGLIFALSGANGSGKTTLLRLLASLLFPTSGSVKVNGYDTVKEEQKVRASVGIALGGERSFYWRLTGLQNLKFFASVSGHSSSFSRIPQIIASLGLEDVIHKKFMTYSSGYKRRLDLARSLLKDPPILLLDEPTSFIDPQSALVIRQLILDLKARGKTIVLVTHNLLEAERICDRIGILDKGKLIAEGDLSNLRASFPNACWRLQTSPPLKESDRAILLKVEGVEKVETNSQGVLLFVRKEKFSPSSLLSLAGTCDWEITHLALEEPSLEDIFLKLTEKR
ncbi:MAG: ABC transporter ATP-binding protein [Caldiserica bacterium]|nr:ABC transporter ATP-binding protein [Caldisericota bacterium]